MSALHSSSFQLLLGLPGIRPLPVQARPCTRATAPRGGPTTPGELWSAALLSDSDATTHHCSCPALTLVGSWDLSCLDFNSLHVLRRWMPRSMLKWSRLSCSRDQSLHLSSTPSHCITPGKSLTLSEPLRLLQETRITVMLSGYLSHRIVGF